MTKTRSYVLGNLIEGPIFSTGFIDRALDWADRESRKGIAAYVEDTKAKAGNDWVWVFEPDTSNIRTLIRKPGKR